MVAWKSLDFFPKASSTVEVRSASGGALTVVSAALIAVLVLGEIAAYVLPPTEEYVGVDQSFGEHLELNVDLEFPSSPCRLVNFDVVDSTGEEQYVSEELTRAPQPNPKAAAREGCRVSGTVALSKVRSNFHFALGRGVPGTAIGSAMSTDPFAKTMVGAQHQHRFDMNQLQLFNASHVVHHLSFGDRRGRQPLNGVSKSVESGKAQYNYYISIVPHRYVRASGRATTTYQYSFTEKSVEVPVGATRFPHPGTFFYLDMSALVIQVDERPRSLLHVFSSVCAIVGSVFVLSSFVDSILTSLTKKDK